MKDNLFELEKIIDYKFNNLELLHNALIHTSYAHESNISMLKSNERLEFLGDTVLNMLVSEYIFSIKPEISEGNMTKIRAEIICEECLYEAAIKIGYGEYLFLGNGEMKNGGNKRPSILSDAFEAITAAIYLDSNLMEARKFVLTALKDKIDSVIKNIGDKDHKTKLQEILQMKSNGKINYEIIKEVGPEHDKEYTSVVKFNDEILGQGIGKSKKEAEQNAAGAALKRIEFDKIHI